MLLVPHIRRWSVERSMKRCNTNGRMLVKELSCKLPARAGPGAKRRGGAKPEEAAHRKDAECGIDYMAKHMKIARD